MGSVKDIEPLPNGAVLPRGVSPSGLKFFATKPSFSVFDLKELVVDTIPLKDLSLTMMAAADFEVLGANGFRTHYVGLLDDRNRVVRTTDLKEPSKRLVFRVYDFPADRVVCRPDGTYDYSYFEQNRGKLNGYVMPVEFVFRRGAPEGSSLFRKTIPNWQREGDTASIEKFLRRTGLNQLPNPGDMFPNPIYDFWTKMERSDRPIGDDGNYAEALKISGLTEEQFLMVLRTLGRTARTSAAYLDSVGINEIDGKREYVWDDGPVLADFGATLDEDRWLRNGRQISKEFLRLYLEKMHPIFYAHMNQCKADAAKEGIDDWRMLLKMPVPRYPQDILELAGKLYAAAADVVLGRSMFQKLYNTPELNDLMVEVDAVEWEMNTMR